MRNFYKKLNRFFQNYLPERLYVKLALIAYPALDRRRRGHGVKVARVGELYYASSAHGNYYFDSPYKIGRYLFRKKDDFIESYLLKRYSNTTVKVEPGDIVVDVGANVGEFSRAAAKTANLVVAVEPDPSPYSCLERNARSSPNIVPLQAALSTEDGEVEFFISSSRNNSSVIEPLDGWTTKTYVPALTLNTIMHKLGINRIDFLKVEAEGYEPEVLLGARDALKHVRKIAVDASPERRGESTKPECKSILQSSGFHVYENGHMLFAINETLDPSSGL